MPTMPDTNRAESVLRTSLLTVGQRPRVTGAAGPARGQRRTRCTNAATLLRSRAQPGSTDPEARELQRDQVERRSVMLDA